MPGVPSWVAVYELAQQFDIEMTEAQAQELVVQLRRNGWELVPGWIATEIQKESRGT